MKAKVVKNRINRILIGAIIWGIFYLNVFYDDFIWDHTFIGELFTSSYSSYGVYSIKIIFFFLVSINLYSTTVGKANSVFNAIKALNIIIFSSLLVLVVQWYLIDSGGVFHYGFFGFLFGDNSYSHLLEDDNLIVYTLYVFSNYFEYVYYAGIVIYLYQLYKTKFSFELMYLVRIAMIIYIYSLSLGTNIQGFELSYLIYAYIYIGFGLIVYIKSKYSLASLYLALALVLFL